MAELAGWGNFYVIVGGAAGALIGLQFVVITLIAERPVVAGQELAGSAFATPTIVHLGAVLLLSAVVCAPLRGVTGIGIFWGLLGTAGRLAVSCSAALRRVCSTGRISNRNSHQPA